MSISNWKVNAYIIYECHFGLLGNTIYAPVGGNAYFSWRLLPLPTLNEPIWIVGTETQRLFYFSNVTARATETYKDRLEFIGYTYGGDMQFILNDVNMSDSGIYSALYAGGTFAGQELVVLCKWQFFILKID